jgi:hypothetical protein
MEWLSPGHRYLMTRLSLQVVYLWRHVSSTAPPFILWWSNLEILFGTLHRSSPFIGELRYQAIQMEHGPYIAETTQNAVYIVSCLWSRLHPTPLVLISRFGFPGWRSDPRSYVRVLTYGRYIYRYICTVWSFIREPQNLSKVYTRNFVYSRLL